jgi:hypothetical protein
MDVSYVPVSVENHMPAPPMHAAKTSASRHTIARASSQGVTELHQGVNAASQRQASRCADAVECEGSIRGKNAAKRLHKRNHARCGPRCQSDSFAAIGRTDAATVNETGASRWFRQRSRALRRHGLAKKKTARDAGRFGNAGGSVS